jgi:hypothetical protein
MIDALSNNKGPVGACYDLFSQRRQPTANASHYGRGSSDVLLCRAAGLGVLKSRGLRPALAHALSEGPLARPHSACFFNSSFVVALQIAKTTRGNGCAGKRQHHCHAYHRRNHTKQRDRSKQVLFHQPVPRLGSQELGFSRTWLFTNQKFSTPIKDCEPKKLQLMEGHSRPASELEQTAAAVLVED